jgi:site-specific recombinase XerD
MARKVWPALVNVKKMSGFLARYCQNMASLGYVKALRRWRVRWRATNRKTHYVFAGSRVFLEKSQAVRFYAEIEAQEKLVRSGQVVPSESLNIVIQNFNRHIKRHTSRTQQHYRMVMDLFVQSIPKPIIRIHQIESSHIQDYLYSRRDLGVKNRTLNAHLTVLKAFCRFYSERFNIGNPASRIKLLKEEPPNNRFLTKDEYQKILGIAHPLAKHRVIFLANTGLRASEFSQLSINSISPQTTAITIIGKGRRKRTIPLNRTARAVLPYVKPASRKALYFQFNLIAKKAEIPDFGPNALRHYFGTQLLLNGIPASKVAKLMGNSVRVIEKHYAHILTADIAHTTDVLD